MADICFYFEMSSQKGYFKLKSDLRLSLPIDLFKVITCLHHPRNPIDIALVYDRF